MFFLDPFIKRGLGIDASSSIGIIKIYGQYIFSCFSDRYVSN